MSNSLNIFDPEARYDPHPAVLHHSLMLGSQHRHRRDLLTKYMTVRTMILYIRGWREMFQNTTFASYYATIEWDLKTHYGVTDEQLS